MDKTAQGLPRHKFFEFSVHTILIIIVHAISPFNLIKTTDNEIYLWVF
jgi:hypothetical protein